MTDTPEMTKRHPNRVSCHLSKDGGATVTAEVGYMTVYRRSFSDQQEARDMAAELFHQTYDAPTDLEYEPDF